MNGKQQERAVGDHSRRCELQQHNDRQDKVCRPANVVDPRRQKPVVAAPSVQDEKAGERRNASGEKRRRRYGINGKARARDEEYGDAEKHQSPDGKPLFPVSGSGPSLDTRSKNDPAQQQTGLDAKEHEADPPVRVGHEQAAKHRAEEGGYAPERRHGCNGPNDEPAGKQDGNGDE